MSRLDETEPTPNLRDKWENAPIDWGRVFRGEPFTGPKEKPLFRPMKAIGPFTVDPPEDVDTSTGEVTPREYWEKRGNEWWPVAAHERADRSEYRVFASAEKSGARAAVEREFDKRAGKD